LATNSFSNYGHPPAQFPPPPSTEQNENDLLNQVTHLKEIYGVEKKRSPGLAYRVVNRPAIFRADFGHEKKMADVL
jgi:hypothetical protein